MTVVSVNPANVIDFLFEKRVIGDPDMRALMRFRDDPQQQCGELLALLYTSGNPQAFVQLYAAIKEQSDLQWLIDRIDEFIDQSVTVLLEQQLHISDPKGVFFTAQCTLVQMRGLGIACRLSVRLSVCNVGGL